MTNSTRFLVVVTIAIFTGSAAYAEPHHHDGCNGVRLATDIVRLVGASLNLISPPPPIVIAPPPPVIFPQPYPFFPQPPVIFPQPYPFFPPYPPDVVAPPPPRVETAPSLMRHYGAPQSRCHRSPHHHGCGGGRRGGGHRR